MVCRLVRHPIALAILNNWWDPIVLFYGDAEFSHFILVVQGNGFRKSSCDQSGNVSQNWTQWNGGFFILWKKITLKRVDCGYLPGLIDTAWGKWTETQIKKITDSYLRSSVKCTAAMVVDDLFSPWIISLNKHLSRSDRPCRIFGTWSTWGVSD